MNRLDRMIARLTTQRACLSAALALITDIPGPILEIGFGKGRSYDFLRHAAPSREIYAFDHDGAPRTNWGRSRGWAPAIASSRSLTTIPAGAIRAGRAPVIQRASSASRASSSLPISQWARTARAPRTNWGPDEDHFFAGEFHQTFGLVLEKFAGADQRYSRPHPRNRLRQGPELRLPGWGREYR